MLIGFIEAGLEREACDLLAMDRPIFDALERRLCPDVVCLIKQLVTIPCANPTSDNFSPIARATAQGMTTLVNAMLATEAVQAADETDVTAALFVGACVAGDVDRVNSLLSNKPTPRLPLVKALKLAATNGQSRVVELLLTNPQSRQVYLAHDCLTVTSLNETTVQLLLSSDCIDRNTTHQAQFELACTSGMHSIIGVVLKRANLTILKVANSALISLVSGPCSEAALRLVLDQYRIRLYATLHRPYKKMLLSALRYGRLPVIKCLTEVYRVRADLMKSARAAILNDDPRVASYFLSTNIDRWQDDESVQTITSLAFTYSASDAVVRQLLDSPHCDLDSAFIFAITNKRIAIVHQLIQNRIHDLESNTLSAAVVSAIQREEWGIAGLLLPRVDPSANENEIAKELGRKPSCEAVPLLQELLADERIDPLVLMKQLVIADKDRASTELFSLCLDCPRVDLVAAVRALEETIYQSGNVQYVKLIASHPRAK